MGENKFFDGTGRSPVDGTAKRVVSGGFSYESKKKIAQRHWSICPKTKRVPQRDKDLTGVKFGFFTVIGLYAHAKKRWVVRCVCGDFEVRKARAIKNPNNNKDRCDKCRAHDFAKKSEYFRRTGRRDYRE